MNKLILHYQRCEMNDYLVYTKLANKEKNLDNKKVLEKIASDEKNHYEVWKSYTKQDVNANKLRVFWYTLISYIFGFTFIIKLMEKKEELTSDNYNALIKEYPDIKIIKEQEEEHEHLLINMLKEEQLEYTGSIVLGLNDALVELTGTIAGLSLAFANNRMIAISGIITGISATLSMATSNYLAQKADNNTKAFKSSLYTGIAYLITVILLVSPYLILQENEYILALIIMLSIVVLIILIFTYYMAITKDHSFKKQFIEMLVISLGVASISFMIGMLAKSILNIEV